MYIYAMVQVYRLTMVYSLTIDEYMGLMPASGNYRIAIDLYMNNRSLSLHIHY